MKVRVLFIVTVFLLFITSFAVLADVYKWIDEKGIPHLDFRPPMQDVSGVEPLFSKAGCDEVIQQRRDSVGDMRKKARYKLKTGRITHLDYRIRAFELRRIERTLSLSICGTVNEKLKSFYNCLSDSGKHLAYCVNAYQASIYSYRPSDYKSSETPTN